ncbi:hypothetical protein [Paenarthrobacter sp.]|uniref:hypothetical protein n=1 Tax=Paenarthrobacter sp. TaxID=1931993 RepID=UPI0028115B40|nr:hypothetical protein [Paenarthrobacter sp.]
MSHDPWSIDEECALATRSPSTGWRYGPKDRVVLGGKGLTLGISVAHLTFCALLSSQSPELAVVFFIYSLLPVWAVGAAVGSLLGLALRRVRNQWLHVAAFFAAGLLVCVPFGAFSSTGSLLFPTSIAVAAGVGRLAIWKLVRINRAGEPM